MNINNTFFFKGADVLIELLKSDLKDCYGMKLSKKTNIGYARVHQLLNIFEKEGIIIFEKLNARTKIAKLTIKGRNIAELLLKIKHKL